MASKYTEIIVCPKCGAKSKVTVSNGVWPMRMPETGECPTCGTEIIRKNITGNIEVLKIEEITKQMKKYNYKDLDLYKAAKELVLNVYALLRKFPKEEQYALCDQLRRAVISIPSNIAEGLGRVSTKEQIHFLEIAYGSLMEVECQIDIAYDLSYISQDSINKVEELIDVVAALLSGLRNKYLSSLNTNSLNTKH